MKRLLPLRVLVCVASSLLVHVPAADADTSERPVFTRVGPASIPPEGGPVIVLTWSGHDFGQYISFSWVDGDRRPQKWCGVTGFDAVGDRPLRRSLCWGNVSSPVAAIDLPGFMTSLRLPASATGTVFRVNEAVSVHVTSAARPISLPTAAQAGTLCDQAAASVRENRSKRLVGLRWLEARPTELQDCRRARPGFYRVRDDRNEILTYLYVPSSADMRELCAVDPTYPRC